MKKLCFATQNKHKLEEVRQMLSGKYEILGLSSLGYTEELTEDFRTLEENSRQKADFIFRKFNLPTFADDSGLEVEVLGGRPGVDSAHYAGHQRNSKDNIALLLKNLQGDNNRKARFRSVITLISAKGTKQFEGVVNGEIIFSAKGIGGFGYDPVFLPEGSSCTLAEMKAEEKNSISHRALAVKKLVDCLLSNPDL